MKPAYSKKPTGVGLLACVEQGLLTANRSLCQSLKCDQQTGGKILTTAKILRKCKNMAQPHLFLTRRSFYAVGQSCVINLNPTQRIPKIAGNAAHLYPAPMTSQYACGSPVKGYAGLGGKRVPVTRWVAPLNNGSWLVRSWGESGITMG